jgi:hypothetical protein
MGHRAAEAGEARVSVLEEMRALYAPDDEDRPDWETTRDSLRSRITILSDRAWENRVKWDLVERWLANFTGESGLRVEEEQVHALYLLSQFLYFGSREIRVLLRALYRDLFLLPLIQDVRAKNGGLRDPARLRVLTQAALEKTRFLGIGNPSESGVHLLYFFRQENGLKKHHFLDTAQILERVRRPNKPDQQRLRFPSVERYIFVDDVCGSGDTAVNYSTDFLGEVKAIKPKVVLSYLAMFSTAEGMQTVRDKSIFGQASSAVYELDQTYQCFSDDSRYLKVVPENISPEAVRKIGLHYGALLWPEHPCGYLRSELLLGFHHNTPDNTVPIIWMDETHGSPQPWTPAFRRYPKV